MVETKFSKTNISVQGFQQFFIFLRNLIMLLKSSILYSHSFVLHRHGTECNQECNGSIHIASDLAQRLSASYDIVDIVLNSSTFLRHKRCGGGGGGVVIF